MTDKDFLRRAAEPGQARYQQVPSGRHDSAGRSSSDKMHFFASFERQDKNEGRSIVYPTRPDKSFSVAQETNSFNYMGRLDHQMKRGNNYSVRFLWDHQPNYNQVLTTAAGVGLGGTVDTLSIEKDNDWALVGTYNRSSAGRS
jgi:hypothetical protein